MDARMWRTLSRILGDCSFVGEPTSCGGQYFSLDARKCCRHSAYCHMYAYVVCVTLHRFGAKGGSLRNLSATSTLWRITSIRLPYNLVSGKGYRPLCVRCTDGTAL